MPQALHQLNPAVHSLRGAAQVLQGSQHRLRIHPVVIRHDHAQRRGIQLADDFHAVSRGAGTRRRRNRLRDQRKMKRRSVPQLALHPQRTVHLLRQRHADRQTQARPAVLAANRGIHLAERLEDPGVVFGCDPGSRIADNEFEQAPAALE